MTVKTGILPRLAAAITASTATSTVTVPTDPNGFHPTRGYPRSYSNQSNAQREALKTIEHSSLGTLGRQATHASYLFALRRCRASKTWRGSAPLQFEHTTLAVRNSVVFLPNAEVAWSLPRLQALGV